MEHRNYNMYPSSGFNPLSKRNNPVEPGNRKLIRPSLTEYKEQQEKRQHEQQAHKPKQKRPVPPEQTNAENFYYVKQMQAKTPMVVVLHDGEELHGVIEWYDRACIKVNRVGAPNLLVYKANIKYLYKESDKNGGAPAPEADAG